jgi:hypothetical protein
MYWWWEWRGMRGMNPVLRAYARLERYASLLGIRPASQQTPEERRDVYVRELPIAEPPITAITRLYTAERYGVPRGTSEKRQETADRAWQAARGRIVKRWARRTFVPFARDERKNKRRKRP